MEKLTTVELVNELQTAYKEVVGDLSKDKTREILDLTFDVIVKNVELGNQVPINGIGVFKPKTIEGREGTLAFGSKAGEKWKSEDKKTMSFKVSKGLEF